MRFSIFFRDHIPFDEISPTTLSFLGISKFLRKKKQNRTTTLWTKVQSLGCENVCFRNALKLNLRFEKMVEILHTKQILLILNCLKDKGEWGEEVNLLVRPVFYYLFISINYYYFTPFFTYLNFTFSYVLHWTLKRIGSSFVHWRRQVIIAELNR